MAQLGPGNHHRRHHRPRRRPRLLPPQSTALGHRMKRLIWGILIAGLCGGVFAVLFTFRMFRPSISGWVIIWGMTIVIGIVGFQFLTIFGLDWFVQRKK